MGKKKTCKRKILIVEDEEVLAENLSVFLGSSGAKVAVAHSGEQALDMLEHFKPEWVVSDYNLPGINGLDVIAHIRELHPHIACVLITAESSPAVAAAAWEMGVVQVLAKPFPLPELRTHICGTRGESVEPIGGVQCQVTFATQ